MLPQGRVFKRPIDAVQKTYKIRGHCPRGGNVFSMQKTAAGDFCVPGSFFFHFHRGPAVRAATEQEGSQWTRRQSGGFYNAVMVIAIW